MSKQSVYAWIKGVGCLVVVYAPTFVLVSLLIQFGVFGQLTKSEAQTVAIPLIIVISTVIALGIIALTVRRRSASFAAYGLRATTLRYVAIAIVLGLLFALALRAITWIVPINESLDMGDLRRWQVVVYFWLAAPIQI